MNPEVLRLFSLWDHIWETTPQWLKKLKGDPQQLADLEISWHLQALGKSSTILAEKPEKGHPFLLAMEFIPISQEMRYGLKTGKSNHFSQFGWALTWSSWQPLLLIKLGVSSLGSTIPESRRQQLPMMRTPGKQFRTPKISRAGSKNNDSHPWRVLSPALVTPGAE